MKLLPSGDVIHQLRTDAENPQTLDAIGKRYGVSRQAVYKVHKRWAERNEVSYRVRPVPSATEEM